MENRQPAAKLTQELHTTADKIQTLANSGYESHLLHALQITPLWFAAADCEALSGEGNAWKALKVRLDS